MINGIKRALYISFIIVGVYIYLILNATHISGNFPFIESLLIVVGIMIFASAGEILMAHIFEKKCRKENNRSEICNLKAKLGVSHNFLLLIISLSYYGMMDVLGFSDLPRIECFIIVMSALFVAFSIGVITYYKFFESKRK